MALTKYHLGDLIELSEIHNTNLDYGLDSVMGMTITKQIIPTKADASAADLSKYLIVYPNDFVYNPRTHGKKIGLGFNNTETTFLISWNNIAFRIKKTAESIIVPEYLFMHFNRSEWDREACFNSWGSSTEVFSWDAMCDMEIELPDIKVQQKFVDIYNALIANQKAYEQGLEDLKLTCDAYIEDLRRKMPCEKIGPYLRESDLRNTIGLGVESVRGLATSKEMIQTKADMNGVNLDSYKLVKPKQIAYVADTSRRGDKISIGYNDTENDFLVSSISIVFGADRNHLLSEYLILFLTRNEFDRYARFHSWGSARETFTWNDLIEVEIPIPSIEDQKSISDVYTAYKSRKQINEQLKLQIKDICPILIKGSLQEARNS